ncbi:MAG: avidin [Acidimicrobiales bacterium]|nr:avidin [Hyphomonadaceae bacterium]RZV44723.1 MAG: avidin [Acidimicrobiales bacterium]
MFNMRYFLTSLFVFLCAACAQADDIGLTVDFNGAWNNDMGSQAVFTVTDGEVRGTYNTNVGEPEKGQSFPLIGFVQDDQITFTVNFKGFGSMTAWVGQLTFDAESEPYIRTLWHLTKDVEDTKESDDIWGSIRTGASEFRRARK